MEFQLKKFKTVHPHKEFRERSKALILSSTQTKTVPAIYPFLDGFLNYRFIALTSLIAILLIGGLSIFNNKTAPSLANGLDQQSIAKEAKDLDIQIQLSQVRYYQDSAQKIEVALNEASDEYAASKAHQKKLDELLNELTL